MDDLPLNALRVFEAVATRLSFSEAADALNVTPAAVSQQIKALEEYLQIPVLRRSGRKVELTPEGAKLLPGRAVGARFAGRWCCARRGWVRASGIVNVSTLSSLLQKVDHAAPAAACTSGSRSCASTGTLRARPSTSRRCDYHAAVRLGEAVTPGLESRPPHGRMAGGRRVAQSCSRSSAPSTTARY